MIASPIIQAWCAIKTIFSATMAVPKAMSCAKAEKCPRGVASLLFGMMALTMSKVGAMNKVRISSACHCAACVNGKSVQPAIAAITQKIGVSERRRLSIIFQRDNAGTPERGSKMKLNSCQSPRAQRWVREASTQ